MNRQWLCCLAFSLFATVLAPSEGTGEVFKWLVAPKPHGATQTEIFGKFEITPGNGETIGGGFSFGIHKTAENGGKRVYEKLTPLTPVGPFQNAKVIGEFVLNHPVNAGKVLPNADYKVWAIYSVRTGDVTQTKSSPIADVKIDAMNNNANHLPGGKVTLTKGAGNARMDGDWAAFQGWKPSTNLVKVTAIPSAGGAVVVKDYVRHIPVNGGANSGIYGGPFPAAPANALYIAIMGVKPNPANNGKDVHQVGSGFK